MRSGWRTFRLFVCVLLVWLSAATSSAQVQTGEIFGRVSDGSGAVLPGVTVTLQGPSLITPETAVTTDTGAYQFVNVPGGTYAIRFELPGFRSVVREPVVIVTGFAAQIHVTLALSNVEETVTVVGQSPVVDVKQTTTGATFTQDMLQSIPSARDPWVLLEQTPGMTMDRQNVGGNKSGQQSTFTVHGTQIGNSMWNVDGVTITDMAATGSSSVYFDFDSFQEISFTTGGADASIQTGGVNLNFITKSGANTPRGSGRFFVSDNNFQSDNVTSELRAQGAGSGNPLKNIKDYGVEIGGPIRRNKAWFWGAYGRQNIGVGVIGFLKPGATDPNNPDNLNTDLTELTNYNIKLNVQPSVRHRFSFLYTFSDKARNARGAGPLNPPETTFRQTGPTPIYKGAYQWVPTDRLVFDTTVGYVDGGFNLDFHEDSLADVQRILDVASNALSRANQRSGPFERPQTEIKTDAHYFASNRLGGEHALKFGARYRNTPFNSQGHFGGFATARVNNGTPVEADLHRDNNSRTAMSAVAAYLNDSFTRARWTINGGVRADHQKDRALPATVAANPIAPELLPALEFPGADSGVTFLDISPRFGVTYDLTGNGKTVVKAGANRFFGQGIFTADLINPVGASFVRFPWRDANVDRVVQRSELDLSTLVSFSANYNPANPANVTSSNAINPTLRNDTVDELIAGLDRELLPNFGVGVAYIYRRIGNFNFDRPTGLTADQFAAVPFTARCGNASCEQASYATTYYQLANAVSTRVRTSRDFHRTFNGIEVTARRRLANRWMLNGSFNWNSAIYRSSPDGFADTVNPDLFAVAALPTDPTNRQFIDGEQTLINGARWTAKLSGLYQLPGGVNVSGALNARDGFPLIPNVLSPARTGRLGTIRVMVEPYATHRYDSLMLLDLKAEKSLTLRKTKVVASVDLFNVTNANTVLSRVTTQNSTLANNVLEITGPRVVRFGARFTF